MAGIGSAVVIHGLGPRPYGGSRLVHLCSQSDRNGSASSGRQQAVSGLTLRATRRVYDRCTLYR